MTTTLRKWGNSYGILITRAMLDQTNIRLGDEFKAEIKNDTLVFSPTPKLRKCPSLAEMIASIPKDGGHKLLRKGPPVGKEIW